MRASSARPPAARLRPTHLLLLAAFAGAGGCDLLSPEPKVSALRAAEGDAQTDTVLATLRTQVVVEAVESGGDGVKGKEILFRAGNGGTVTPDRAKTDGDGRARVTWTLGSGAGAQTLTARLASDTTITASFSATAQAGSLAGLVVAQGDRQSGAPGSPLPVAFSARDAHGNGKAGVALSLAVTRGGGTVGLSTGTTGADGRLETTWRLGGQSIDQRLTATAERFSVDAVANVDTLHNIVFFDLPESAAVGDTIDAAVRVILTGLGGERRGMLAATFTYPTGTLTPVIVRLRDNREVWTNGNAAAPAGSSAVTLAVTRPRNDDLSETAFVLRFVVRARPPAGSDLPLALAVNPGGLVAVQTFNDLSRRVNVVGDVIRIR